MCNLDFVLAVVCSIQPFIVVIILAVVSRESVSSSPWRNFNGSQNRSLDDIRFFESAAPNSNLNSLEFGIQNYVFLVMFIIYDVDLLFFLIEVMVWDMWAFFDITILTILLAFIIFGLFYDYKKKALYWS